MGGGLCVEEVFCFELWVEWLWVGWEEPVPDGALDGVELWVGVVTDDAAVVVVLGVPLVDAGVAMVWCAAGSLGTVSAGKLSVRSLAVATRRLAAATFRLAASTASEASTYFLRSFVSAAWARFVSALASALKAAAKPDTTGA